MDESYFEKALVSSIVLRKDMRKVLKQKIDHGFFENSMCRSIFSWLVKYYKNPKTTDTPGVESFKRQFPSFELVESDDSTEAICEEVRKAKLYSDIADVLTETSNKTQADALEGYDYLRQQISRLNSTHLVSDANDVRNMIDSLKEDYLRMEALKGDQKLKGRPYPWPCLNEATMGCQNGHLVFIYARPKSGKTFVLLFILDSFYESGAVPLVCSQELPTIDMVERIVAFRLKLDYSKFLRGELDPLSRQRFFDGIEQFIENPPYIITRLTSAGEEAAQELDALIEEYGATVAAVDAANCLGNDVKEVVGFTRGFKQTAIKRNIPILGTTQQLRQKGKKSQQYGSENGDDVYGSDSYLQDCDLLLLAKSDLEMRRAREIELSTVAIRKGRPIRFIINSFLCTNFEQKRIVPFGDEEEDDAAQTLEALDQSGEDTFMEPEPQEEAVPAQEKPKPTITFGKPKGAKFTPPKNRIFVPASPKLVTGRSDFEKAFDSGAVEFEEEMELVKPVKKLSLKKS